MIDNDQDWGKLEGVVRKRGSDVRIKVRGNLGLKLRNKKNIVVTNTHHILPLTTSPQQLMARPKRNIKAPTKLENYIDYKTLSAIAKNSRTNGGSLSKQSSTKRLQKPKKYCRCGIGASCRG